MHQSDDGELAIAIGVSRRKVVLGFGTLTKWFGFGPAEARALAKALLEKADIAERQADAMSKPTGQRYTVAVDFDGVIHSYTSPWINAETIPDPPVEGAVAWLNEIAEDFEVVIFTTRGKTVDGRGAVRKWLEENGACGSIIASTITAEKPPALIYLDDRAYRFEGPGTFPTKDQIHAARPWNKRG